MKWFVSWTALNWKGDRGKFTVSMYSPLVGFLDMVANGWVVLHDLCLVFSV